MTQAKYNARACFLQYVFLKLILFQKHSHKQIQY